MEEKIKRLQTECIKLLKNRARLKKKCEDLGNVLQEAFEKILEKQKVIEKQKKTIEELKQKLSAQSNESKISTQNEKNSIDQSNRPSLLGKIQSIKDKSHNLEQPGGIGRSRSADSRNQQINK